MLARFSSQAVKVAKASCAVVGALLLASPTAQLPTQLTCPVFCCQRSTALMCA